MQKKTTYFVAGMFDRYVSALLIATNDNNPFLNSLPMPTNSLARFLWALFITFTPILHLEIIETQQDLQTWHAYLLGQQKQVHSYIYIYLSH